MKESVEVNGVKLTRAQVEQALQELNPPAFRTGDRVRWSGNLVGIVLTSGEVFNMLNAKHGGITKGYVRVICIEGGQIGASYSPSTSGSLVREP